MTSHDSDNITAQRRSHRRVWLRNTLRRSQQEAVASSAMTATSDNFFNAFAIFLQASLAQMGWVTGLPQLFGAACQLASVWIGSRFTRRTFTVAGAVVQSLGLLALAALALFAPADSVWLFIALAMLYHGILNLIQPHWRAWMGSIVPERRRGTFFAARTRLTMAASLAIFFIGGGVLSWTDTHNAAGVGFCLLFCIAAVGRIASARLLWQMHDPQRRTEQRAIASTLRNFASAWKDPVFRHYSLFVAGMHCMVAISAPFFAVYMLKELELSYFQFVGTSIASIITQFLTLRLWGSAADRFGNRQVMLLTSAMIPTLPALWIFSDSFLYILAIQAVSGFAWSGFTLTTANYLYDIRPHHSDFALYAALQAAMQALLVFCGAVGGGAIASHAGDFLLWSGADRWLASPIFVVFLVSSSLRLAVFLWFAPRAVEPSQRPRPKLLEIVFRVARFNAISGVSLDWLTVTRKKVTAKKDR